VSQRFQKHLRKKSESNEPDEFINNPSYIQQIKFLENQGINTETQSKDEILSTIKNLKMGKHQMTFLLPT